MRHKHQAGEQQDAFLRDMSLFSPLPEQTHVTCANSAVVVFSGFDAKMLPSQAHDMRHYPNMSKQALSEIWASMKTLPSQCILQKKHPVTGAYCTLPANVVYTNRNRHALSNMSVRAKPTVNNINAAEKRHPTSRHGSL